MANGFLVLFHPHTDSPEEKLNLVLVNKDLLIRILSTIPNPHIAFFNNDTPIKQVVNLVHKYLFNFRSFSVFIA